VPEILAYEDMTVRRHYTLRRDIWYEKDIIKQRIADLLERLKFQEYENRIIAICHWAKAEACFCSSRFTPAKNSIPR